MNVHNFNYNSRLFNFICLNIYIIIVLSSFRDYGVKRETKYELINQLMFWICYWHEGYLTQVPSWKQWNLFIIELRKYSRTGMKKENII